MHVLSVVVVLPLPGIASFGPQHASASSSAGNNDGGLSVVQEMRDILAKPGFLGKEDGGLRLRALYVSGSMKFNPMRLSPFGLCCFVGRLDDVREKVEARQAPDIKGSETPFEFGYATLIVAGAQRVEPNETTKHTEVLTYLISRGLPIDVPDIVCMTALHHAVGGPSLQLDLARALLQAGAGVNYQTRYGEVPLFPAFMRGYIPAVDLLMEFGADLDIKEADGVTPGGLMLTYGPQVTAMVQKWIRRRAGEEAPREEKRCNNCARTDVGLKNCSRCHIAMYCSLECQRKAWPEHKKTCQPFSKFNTLTFKPSYNHVSGVIPFTELRNAHLGINDPTPAAHHRSAHLPKGINSDSKALVIKVQVPMGGAGPLLVYTKKRDLVCQLERSDGPGAYDRLAEVVKEKGVGGLKAYFAAELRSKDELVVKVSQVLAELPF